MTYMIGEEIWRIWGRSHRFVRERERSKTAKIAEEKRKMRKKKKGRLMY